MHGHDFDAAPARRLALRLRALERGRQGSGIVEIAVVLELREQREVLIRDAELRAVLDARGTLEATPHLLDPLRERAAPRVEKAAASSRAERARGRGRRGSNGRFAAHRESSQTLRRRESWQSA